MTEHKPANVSIQSISIGNRNIIKNLNFNLNLGDILLLKAPNGTGKSVLLSVLAGWDNNIDSINIHGEYSNEFQSFDFQNDINKYRNYAREKIGYLSHKLIEESLGVKYGEEIDFIIKKNKSIPNFILNSISYLNQCNSQDSVVEKMAKGHKQLMAIIDIFSNYENYDLILLDEPTSYLNDDNFKCFIEQLKFIAQKNNCAIIIASNDIRLFNQNFSQLILTNQDREKKEFVFPQLPFSINLDSISIKINGYPIGHSGKLPFHFNEEIKKDESVIIIGQNGVGKSTFLNVCARLMRIKGEIDHYSNNQKIKRKQLFPSYLSFLFQEPSDYEFRSTADEILCVPENIKNKSFFHELYENILSYYAIPKDQNPKTLSSGQLRILWLVSMLGWSSRWILDEPDASLDEKSLSLFFQLMDFHLANNGTVIIVTHNKELYRKYNFRVIELK